MLATLPTPPSLGIPSPRVGPPRPVSSDIDGFRREAECLGIDLYPWQDLVGWYLNALAPDGNYLYPETAEVVARQNGKTEVLVPHICDRLLKGRRIMHTAQNRELPREVFGRVADHMYAKHWSTMTRKPRFANGQEEIRLHNRGDYRIIAPSRSGARGHPADDLIIDEVRELDTIDFIAAAKPALSASPNPQALYVSNAGDETSIVLNALKNRAGEDPSLAFLEWSAAPERDAGDLDGWLESNPSAGHMAQKIPNLRQEYRAHLLGGTMAVFETEYLCRWVKTMRTMLVESEAWQACYADRLGIPVRPFGGVSMDPDGKRASLVMAWQMKDGTIAVRSLLEASNVGENMQALGEDIRDLINANKIIAVGFDPMTDGEIAKYLRKPEPIRGGRFANASSTFVLNVQGQRVAWHDADALTLDLAWTTRKEHDETGRFQAVRADDNRPITAALAAIRAVELASGPPVGGARIW